jgi:predicted NUDIX family NTP pyrophosphohydrolase
VPKTSAGILLYRRRAGALEVLLGHMGGPYWAGKDEGAWSLPKGEHGPDEQPFDAALREFHEELGVEVPAHTGVLALGSVRQSGGKLVTAFAIEGELAAGDVVSNMVSIEWPRRSGRTIEVPEMDRVGWFGVDEARRLVVKAQAEFLDRLLSALGEEPPAPLATGGATR